jgi:putative DNA primase/helicase
LNESNIGFIVGWRGTGKTMAAISVADAITKAEPFGPWKPGEAVPCLYLEAEMATQDVRDRFETLTNEAERKAPLYVYSDAYANQLGLPRASLLSENWRAMMAAILKTRGIKFWVIDNLASLTGGIDENSKRDWDPMNAWLLELRFAGISTLLLHHTGKSGDQRGTSAREDNLDFSIQLRQPPDYVPEDGCRFIVSFRKARIRTADLHLIADTQFHLVEGQDGKLVWTWGSVRQETRIEVLKLLDEGHSQTDVAQILGIHKGTVSKIRKQAIKDCFLTAKNKLSKSGFRTVYGSDEQATF